jgi:2-C-methyl-D-erythritol 4-phosphate cytidylyltransferase
MGGQRKPFLELAGEPVLLHALRPFLDHPRVAAVVVALAEEDLAQPPAWLGRLDPGVRLVAGGRTRGESVRNALEALPGSIEYVAIHDAARPLITREILDRCLEAVGPDRGVVAGWPAVDTLKEVDVGDRPVVMGTPDRGRIWHAHTPQLFPVPLVREAYRIAVEEGVEDTDDSALVERIGGEVVMIPGSPFNIKITQPADLLVAELLLGGVGS